MFIPNSPEAAHKYDVFIFHGDSDLRLAQQILLTIEANELSGAVGSYKSDAIAEAVKSARRVVVLLSRDLLKTERYTLFLFLLVSVSLCLFLSLPLSVHAFVSSSIVAATDMSVSFCPNIFTVEK